MKNNFNLIKFSIYYLSFWVLYFILDRILFLTYNFEESSNLDFETIIQTFIYGFKLDLSISAYLTLLPLIVYSLKNRISFNLIDKILKYYSVFLLIASTILVCFDLELYPYWKYRIDSSNLFFLKNPLEIIASATFINILTFSILLPTILGLSYICYRKIHFTFTTNNEGKFSIPFTILLIILMIIFSRGGIQKIALNQSDVFFSKITYANHVALNPEFNFIFYLFKDKNSNKNQYEIVPIEIANFITKKKFIDSTHDKNSVKILTTKRPNILLIILESFTAKVVEPLSGLKDIAPNLSNIAKEGLLFDNFYANSDRSPKGLVSVLSGYPAQPANYIIEMISKTKKLAYLSNSLNEQGYNSSFYYGGDLSFANYISYIHNGNFQSITGLSDFKTNNPKERNSWGVHDHILFNRILEDSNKFKSPFFSTILTLTSHEPFEIPTTPKFEEKDIETKFLNSLNYTDSTLGEFIKSAKKQPWWKDTLVIIIADHGHSMPGNTRQEKIEKFHIPMIWFGPALDEKYKGKVFSKISSQVDIAKTLLNQLEIDSSKFIWSKDIFNKNYIEFAHYVYNDGFGYVYPKNYFTYDNIGGGITSCKVMEERQKLYPDSFFTEENLDEAIKQSKKNKALFGDFLLSISKKTVKFEQRKEMILMIGSMNKCKKIVPFEEALLGKLYLQSTYQDFLEK